MRRQRRGRDLVSTLPSLQSRGQALGVAPSFADSTELSWLRDFRPGSSENAFSKACPSGWTFKKGSALNGLDLRVKRNTTVSLPSLPDALHEQSSSWRRSRLAPLEQHKDIFCKGPRSGLVSSASSPAFFAAPAAFLAERTFNGPPACVWNCPRVGMDKRNAEQPASLSEAVDFKDQLAASLLDAMDLSVFDVYASRPGGEPSIRRIQPGDLLSLSTDDEAGSSDEDIDEDDSDSEWCGDGSPIGAFDWDKLPTVAFEVEEV